MFTSDPFHALKLSCVQVCPSVRCEGVSKQGVVTSEPGGAAAGSWRGSYRFISPSK